MPMEPFSPAFLINVCRYSDIALDSLGRAHISYYDGWNGNLKHAYYNGSSWSTETVDTGHVGYASSLALDALDRPHISYCKPGSFGVLKYAAYDGSSWSTEVVEVVSPICTQVAQRAGLINAWVLGKLWLFSPHFSPRCATACRKASSV
ncbi:MAG: hypothetical protein ACWGMZ_08430, partial [Thermoguttaceae bacterium]